MAAYHSRVDELHWGPATEQLPVLQQPRLLYPSSAPQTAATVAVPPITSALPPMLPTPLAPVMPAVTAPLSTTPPAIVGPFSKDEKVNQLFILVIVLFVLLFLLGLYTINLNQKLAMTNNFLQYMAAYHRV